MSLRSAVSIFLFAGLSCISSLSGAAGIEEAIRPIQDEWAVIKYHTPDKQQAERYHTLSQRAHQVVEANPGKPEPLIWEAIALSSEAGAKGGLGAMSIAKEAKQQLEEALKLDDQALKGSAYASLGTLYYKVPGWPIGFGNKARAEEYLKKSLSLNPGGIDPNFFYGEYLFERERYADAMHYLDTALKAPPRPGREQADAGRRKEIKALITKVKKQMEN